MLDSSLQSVCVIGSGPSGLMAADVLAGQGYHVTLCDQRKAAGWKLYIAGSSGLNITNDLPLTRFLRHYTGPEELWSQILRAFGPADWIQFIEQDLGLSTFCGTSGRYFVSTMHAARLLREWKKRLELRGVVLRMDARWSGLQAMDKGWRVLFAEGDALEVQAVVLALGGGSYIQDSEELTWPLILQNQGLAVEAFRSSNAGYELQWTDAFLKEAEGQALKNVELRTARGTRKGDLVVTSYGLEGTPIYFYGAPGPAWLDLKVDQSIETILARLQQSRENLSPLRRAFKFLKLSPAAKALLFHMAPPQMTQSLEALAVGIKAFPLDLEQPRPLLESISSQGGLLWDELDEHLMLKKLPGIYAAGEMIDWDAPTGGFLIQACISQGYWVGHAAARRLKGQDPAREQTL